MESKINKGLIVTIVILALLLVGVSGYLVYDKLLSRSNESNESSESEKEEKNNEAEKKEEMVSKEEHDKLLKVINDLNNYNLGRYDNLNPTEISNQDKLAFVSYLVYDNQLNGEDGSIAGLTGTEVSDIYKKYFGTQSSIINKDICPGDYSEYGGDCEFEELFLYSNEKKVYEKGEQALFHLVPPGYETSTTYSFIVDATKKDGVYTVKVQTLYTTPHGEGVIGPGGVIAGSYEDAENKTNDLKDLMNVADWRDDDGNIIQSKVEADYNKVKEKMPVYTYTFVLESGNYVLQNKTIEKK